MKSLLKKNDQVVIITGKNKGKTGKILKVLAEKGKVVVEKINTVKRHMKPTQASPQGGIIDKDLPIDASNVLLQCKKCDKGVRASRKRIEDGTSVRVCKKCGETI